ALEQLYQDGKIRAVGVSKFTINHLEEAMDITDVPITVNQVEFHPLLYQAELLQFCKANNIALTAYAPIAKNNVADDPTIQAVAEKHGKAPAQISIRWVIQHGAIAIPRSSQEDHIKENMDVFDFELSDADMERIGNAPQQRIYEPAFAEFDR
ncbi:MAG: aldo/keto reductase, partial [Halobacteriaceae archaeon]